MRPVVAMVPSASGQGYWLVAADGGIFTFGDAPFLGSAAASRPSSVVGMAATPSGNGYWLVDAAGEVFSFGDAAWFGNAPAGQEIVGIAATRSGDGYWLLSGNAAVFPQGSARAFPSVANQIPATKVALGLAPTPTGEGWILAGDPCCAPLLAGAVGSPVTRLQQRLELLGYWVGPITGQFGALTTQALYALQKAAGIPRTGAFDAASARALDASVRPVARSTAGYVIEIDKSAQLLMQVRDGYVERTFNTSTGTGKAYQAPRGGRAVAVTPEGTFSIYNQINGLRISDLGQLYRPKYFVGGYAIHGSPSIPPFPASHGCVRVSNGAADFFWNSGTLPMGTTVMVYLVGQ